MEQLFSDKSDIEKIHFKSTISIKKLNEIQNVGKINYEIEEYNKEVGLHYVIREKVVTIYSVYCIENNSKKEQTWTYGVTPILEFSLFQKYIVNLVDTYSRTTKKEKEFFKIVTLKESLIIDKDNLILNLLRFVKDNKVTNTNLIKVKDFILTSTLLDNLKTSKENWTTEYCYYGNTHMCPENNWRLVIKSTSKKNGVLYNLVDDIATDFSKESKIHFIEIDKNIENYIELYNNLPISIEEAKVYKIMLCSAISNWFIYFLKSKGFTEIKQMALIGLKGNRKSFIGFNTFGLFNLIDTYDKQSFSREHNINADLKNLYPICLPRFNDEIPGFSHSQKSRFKSKSNGERTHFTKNNFSGGKDFHFDNSIECFTANNLQLNGDDYDDKQFTYEPKTINEIKKSDDDKLINKSKEINKLIVDNFSSTQTRASLMIGKYIYLELLKINPHKILNDMDLEFINDREEKQYQVLKFGEQILNNMKIFDEIPLDKNLYLNNKLSNNTHVESDLDKFKLYFELLISLCEKNNNIKLEDFLKELLINNSKDSFILDKSYQRFYDMLNYDGIYIRYTNNQFELVLTSKIVNRIKYIAKVKFHSNFQYNTLRNLISLIDNHSEKPRNVFCLKKDIITTVGQKSGYSVPLYELYDIDIDTLTITSDDLIGNNKKW